MGSHGLVADIGGTNVRFALTEFGAGKPSIGQVRKYSTKSHPDIAAAARTYLNEIKFEEALTGLVFAVAGPVNDGEIHLTNAGWRISERDLHDKLNVSVARVINDYEALAEAVPVLGPGDLRQIGDLPFNPRGDGTTAIIGPGTGLGVGGFVQRDGSNVPLVTEGGHVAFAPTDDTEIAVLQILMRKFGRVSNERILSGPGLLNLYAAMAQIDGVSDADATPEKITQIAQSDPKSFEAKVLSRFCAILGSAAGDVALGMGARRGVLIAGGILPGLADFFAASDFRKRFKDKARFADYLKAIPTSLITQPHAGLIGAAAFLQIIQE